MSPETPSHPKTKICPTCGTRLSENATRCLVCGTELGTAATPKVAKKAEKAVQASRMPEITLGLPAALGLLALFIVIGAVVVYFGLRSGITGTTLNEPTAIPSPTDTPTASLTPTETLLPTPIPSVTAQAPFDYKVAAGDTCLSLAYNFGVSSLSIIILNNLPASCTTLYVGQVLKIPYPTATAAPLPTATPLEGTQTALACERVVVTVQENDTLSSIAANYAVPQQAIKDYSRAIRLNPDDISAYTYRAAAYDALGDYQQSLTQRNALLKQLAERGGDASQLDFWDDAITRSGAAIILGRIQAVQELEKRKGDSSIAGVSPELLMVRALVGMERTVEALSLLEKAIPDAEEPLPLLLERVPLIQRIHELNDPSASPA